MKLTLESIAALIGSEASANRDAVATGYSIDSRTVGPDELFFAVRGERLDGHDFVKEALAKGAIATVVARDQMHRFTDGSRLLVVADPLTALQQLAAGVRRQWGKPVIAITGSAGKTTTKEMVAAVLATRYRLLKSEGNFNNHFGLPLQLLKLEPEHDLAVLELGMSHRGEITALARLAAPEVGVVTNVAPVHLGFFSSVAEIAQAKRELIEALPADGTAVLNADDEYVSQFGRDFAGRIVTYAIEHPADIRADAVALRGAAGSQFSIAAGDQLVPATLRLIGAHSIYNALAAVAVARHFGIAAVEAAAELARMAPVDKRGEVFQIGGATVINDCYNSNPRALDSMVDALMAIVPGPGGRRIVVAGEMLELGRAAEDLHRRSGRHMARHAIDIVIGVRGEARAIVQGVREQRPKARTEFFDAPEQAGEWLATEVRPGDAVLLKASRGVHLERAFELWRARASQS